MIIQFTVAKFQLENKRKIWLYDNQPSIHVFGSPCKLPWVIHCNTMYIILANHEYDQKRWYLYSPFFVFKELSPWNIQTRVVHRARVRGLALSLLRSCYIISMLVVHQMLKISINEIWNITTQPSECNEPGHWTCHLNFLIRIFDIAKRICLPGCPSIDICYISTISPFQFSLKSTPISTLSMLILEKLTRVLPRLKARGHVY